MEAKAEKKEIKMSTEKGEDRVVQGEGRDIFDFTGSDDDGSEFRNIDRCSRGCRTYSYKVGSGENEPMCDSDDDEIVDR